MSKNILGLSFGVNKLKLVELQPRAGKYLVVNWAIEETIPEGVEPIANLLTGLIKQKHIMAREVYLATSDANLVYQIIELPVLPEEEINSALKLKLEPLLPYPIDEAVFSAQKLVANLESGNQLYFVSALPKAQIDCLLEICHKTGLTPKGIITSACALKNVITSQPADLYALVYVGTSATAIVLVCQGAMIFARQVMIGYNTADDLTVALRPVLEKIEAEIQRTFDYYQEITKQAISDRQVYFTGEIVQTNNFLEYFKASQGFVTVGAYQPIFESTQPDFTAVAPALVVALGTVTPSVSCLYLWQAPDRFKLKITPAMLRSRWAAGLALLLVMFLIWLNVSLRERGVQRQLVILQKELIRAETALGTSSKAYEQLLNIRSRVGARMGKRDRFVSVLNYLNQITPSELFLEKLTYNNKENQLVIKAIVLKRWGNKAVTDYINKLKENKSLQTITLSFLEESARFTAPTYDFEIKCVLAGESK